LTAITKKHIINLYNLKNMNNPLPLLPLMKILEISAAILITAIFILKIKKTILRKKDYFLLILISVILTFFSAFAINTDYSGTGLRTQFGWPHSFYTIWKSMENDEIIKGFSMGPFFSYLFSNLFFYFSILFLFFTTLTPKKNKKSAPAGADQFSRKSP